MLYGLYNESLSSTLSVQALARRSFSAYSYVGYQLSIRERAWHGSLTTQGQLLPTQEILTTKAPQYQSSYGKHQPYPLVYLQGRLVRDPMPN